MKIKKCAYCGKRAIEGTELKGKLYCKDCIDESLDRLVRRKRGMSMFTCSNCSKIYDSDYDEKKVYEGKDYCLDCYPNGDSKVRG